MAKKSESEDRMRRARIAGALSRLTGERIVVSWNGQQYSCRLSDDLFEHCSFALDEDGTDMRFQLAVELRRVARIYAGLANRVAWNVVEEEAAV